MRELNLTEFQQVAGGGGNTTDGLLDMVSGVTVGFVVRCVSTWSMNTHRFRSKVPDITGAHILVSTIAGVESTINTVMQLN